MSVLGSTTEAVWNARERNRSDWRDAAACREPGVDRDWFFEPDDPGEAMARMGWERSASGRWEGLSLVERRQLLEEVWRSALDVCARCPVLAECRAASVDEVYGVWGGLTPTMRRGIRRREESAARRGQLLLVAGSVVGSARASVEASEDAG